MTYVNHCPACDKEVSQAKLVHPRARDGLYRCLHCRSLFSNPRYTPDELDELYRREYYDESVADEQPRWAAQVNAGPLHHTFLNVIRHRYPHLAEPGRRVLDYGCGLGFFLAAAREKGFIPTGIELSSVAAAHAREKLQLDVRTPAQDPLRADPDETYDLVTAFAVIEHVLEPRTVLGQLVDKLKPGGVLALSLPNLNCWRYHVERSRWFNIVNPTHLTFFTLSAIRSLLHELGMQHVRRVIYWGGRAGFGPLAGAAQYLARVANLGSEFRILTQKPPEETPHFSTRKTP